LVNPLLLLFFFVLSLLNFSPSAAYVAEEQEAFPKKRILFLQGELGIYISWFIYQPYEIL
jgi:hypothetical protein